MAKLNKDGKRLLSEYNESNRITGHEDHAKCRDLALMLADIWEEEGNHPLYVERWKWNAAEHQKEIALAKGKNHD